MSGPLFALGEVEGVSTRVAVKIATHEEGARQVGKGRLTRGLCFSWTPS